MAESRLYEAIDILVTLWKATGLTVVDGPNLSSDYYNKKAVFVGWDGDQDGDFLAGDSDQDWAGLGARKRDERLSVYCCLLNPVGNSTTWKAVRDECAQTLNVLAAALRGDPSLGLPSPTTAGLVPGQLYQLLPPEAGALARQPFDVRINTRV